MSEEMKSLFELAEDAINPSIVPYKVLNNGKKMPVLGLGTFGSDSVSATSVANAVIGAAEFGQRLFDCASVYGNEKEIGKAFKVIIDGGLPRSDLFIVSKVWNDMHGDGDVIKSCKQSLEDLGLEYLDLYLVHWPFPNAHPPGCTVDSLAPNAQSYIHEDYMKVWAQMEQLVEMGLVKSIGTSNMTIPKMELVLSDCNIKPVVNELEIHPHMQQAELFNYLLEHDVQPIGFCPLGSPGRPARDCTPDDTVDMEDPVIVKAAKVHGVHPASICLKWAVQRGGITIPFSTNRRNYTSNLTCVTTDPLTDDEMAAIATIDKGCRLVKGQVFRWKSDQSWEVLWDVNGVIEK
jgi:diketogulonate reductase-like aldo/keto reductase